MTRGFPGGWNSNVLVVHLLQGQGYTVTQVPQLASAPSPGAGRRRLFGGLVQWWRDLGGPKRKNPLDRTIDSAVIKANLDERQRRSLWWLTDVPMFFDEGSVQKLYDAIVAPEFVFLQSKEGAEQGLSNSFDAGLEGGGEVTVPPLPSFFKLSLKGKLDGSSASTAKRSAEVTKQFVYNGQQRLQDVVVAYNQAFGERVLYLDSQKDEVVSLAGPTDWVSAEGLLEVAGPRPLVFLDLKPGAPILPMAGETSKGAVVLLYQELEKRWAAAGFSVPKYPSDRDIAAPEALKARKAYWDALIAAYDNRTALEVVEEGFKGGDRIDWIDYRLKLSTRDVPLHLHLAADGAFATGTFAYNLVRRGHKVGLRLVGLLKAGGDINVLAIYER